MREKIKVFLCICLLAVALPYIITSIFQGVSIGGKLPHFFAPGNENDSQNAEPDHQLEEQLLGILAKEIPPDYEAEALKAQAIIARTNLVAALEQQKDPPETLSQEELARDKRKLRPLKKAIKDTAGKSLNYQDRYIYAAYHAVSAGRTRSGEECGLPDTPWLAPRDSYMDLTSPDFLKVLFLSKEEFQEKWKESFSEISLDPDKELMGIEIVSRDGSDYVAELRSGERSIEGEAFREAFGLNSSCLYLAEVDGQIRIVTKGLGHGLGLSQYGANEMAKEGKDSEAILHYYFTDVEIKQ